MPSVALPYLRLRLHGGALVVWPGCCFRTVVVNKAAAYEHTKYMSVHKMQNGHRPGRSPHPPRRSAVERRDVYVDPHRQRGRERREGGEQRKGIGAGESDVSLVPPTWCVCGCVSVRACVCVRACVRVSCVRACDIRVAARAT